MTRKNRRTAAVSVLAAAVLLPAAAAGQDVKPQGYAASTGISLNPDQFHGGVRFQIGSRLQPQIRPVVDVGFGNGVRLFSFGVDALYHFSGTRWRPYAGAGPGLNVIDVTDGVGESDGMTTKLVGHAVSGVTWHPARARRSYFLECRVGVGDTPDLRLAFGMSF